MPCDFPVVGGQSRLPGEWMKTCSHDVSVEDFCHECAAKQGEEFEYLRIEPSTPFKCMGCGASRPDLFRCQKCGGNSESAGES